MYVNFSLRQKAFHFEFPVVRSCQFCQLLEHENQTKDQTRQLLAYKIQIQDSTGHVSSHRNNRSFYWGKFHKSFLCLNT
jgi:hypothetical protein